MSPSKHRKLFFSYSNIFTLIFLMFISGADAKENAQLSAIESRRIEMTFGKSVVIRSELTIKRV